LSRSGFQNKPNMSSANLTEHQEENIRALSVATHLFLIS
jgi:hypothetical protein